MHRQSQYRDDVNPTLEEDSENIGVFAQARFEPTARLQVSTGVRWDWQDFTGKDGSKDDPSGGSANASVVYDVTDALSVRAGYSNVFGGLQLEDNYNFFRAWDYSLLKSARAQNAVVGIDWAQGDFTFAADVFQTKIDDIRNGDTTTDFENRGFNIGSTYDWTSGFARLSFTRTEALIDGDNASSFYILDYAASLGDVLAFEVQQDLLDLNLVVGRGLDVALDYDSNPDEPDPVLELQGYQVVNIFADYTPPAFENLNVRAQVQNLFDEQYADRATYGGDYEDFNTLKEPGRTFSLLLTTTF